MTTSNTPGGGKAHDGADATTSFRETATAQDAGHVISITARGVPYSRCRRYSRSCDNGLGQLGRGGDPHVLLPIGLSDDDDDDDDGTTTTTTGGAVGGDRGGGAATAVAASAAHAYAGGFADSGHSAILDSSGHLWLCGCDRWQQLGLGSSRAGSSGYTWKGGKLWQDRFRRDVHVVELLRRLDPTLAAMDDGRSSSTTEGGTPSRRWIRDVALGGDHTVVLSSNMRDVVAFGKGSEGQLGLSSKPFVSSPAKSKILSSGTADIGAVCAYRNCSIALDVNGGVMSKAGKCSLELRGMKKALDLCRKRAQETGLVK
jgi:alpha-tubulin suppressor-like RCC1 family protein